jgi:DNA recombination protein RmuC
MDLLVIAATAMAAFAAGLAGWALGVFKTRSKVESELREAESRARAAEATEHELREQLAGVKQESEAIRASLRTAEVEKAASEARASEIQRNLDQQKEQLEEAKNKLSDTFGSLAAEALDKNSQSFLTLANERLAPMRDSVANLDRVLRAIEGERREAQGKLAEQLASLSNRTERLVDALKTPSVRGRWGEIQLRRVVEIAGMVEYCDFHEQAGVVTENGRLVPDMTVRLPGGKNVVIDAKVPLQAYMEALEATTEDQRVAKLKDHARQVREHVNQLSAKSYWDACRPTPEFVVLFLPGEMFFSAALQQDPGLIEDGAAAKVILATPTTLIALLKAVAYGWRQERLAENAERISRLAQDLYDRLATLSEHLSKIGGALTGSVKAFNDAVGSFQSRVLPAARSFKELGVGGRKEIAQLEPIDRAPREAALALPDSAPNGNADGDDKPA